MACRSCFKDFISKCPSEIQVYAQLPQPGAYDQYSWIITDKFNHRYSQEFTPGAYGFWVISQSDLPDGFLNQHAGTFKLEVIDGGCDPVPFTIYIESEDENRKYDCIEFEVRGGTQIKTSLGCEF